MVKNINTKNTQTKKLTLQVPVPQYCNESFSLFQMLPYI